MNLRKNKPLAASIPRALESLKSRFAQRLKVSGHRGIAILIILLTLSSGAPTGLPDESWVDRTLKTLTLREKIAQLVQIRVPGKFINHQSSDFEAIKFEIQKNHVGGVVLFAGNVYESAILLNELQAISRLPLLVAADFERGASFRIADTTSFPWAMALGATGNEQFAYKQGLITAQESRALGVHWIYAPVMDVNNNPDNPVINIRSFGEDPALVARMGTAFIRGAKKGGVLTTAKHFPGHGDTSTDSHISLPIVESDMARLQAIELEPFRSAIEAGVDSIMTAHVAVPQVTGERGVPATLSPEILTGLLRETLNFRGLVVTDALEMAGITNKYWGGTAAIRAIQAGADVLLLPANSTVAINEVERAVKLGIISESRIEQSARKILEAKYRMGLRRSRQVSLAQIARTIASPRSLQLAQEIADHSITAVKDEQRLIPLNPAGNRRIFSLVLATDLESSPGSLFQTEMRRRFPSIRTGWANAQVSAEQFSAFDKGIAESELIVCSLFSRLASGQGIPTVPESHKTIYAKLLAARKPVIWTVFGNPYVLRELPQAGSFLCTFSYSDVSQIAAAKVLSGEISARGRMPVSIPGFSRVGDGLRSPKTEMTLIPTPPEDKSLPQKALVDTRQLLLAAVEAGEIPGAQLIAGSQGVIVLNFNVGRLSSSAGSSIVTTNTIYDLDTLSALVGSLSAALIAVDAGTLVPEAPVRDYFPELQNPDVDNLSVQDLMNRFSNEKATITGAIRDDAVLLEQIVSRASGVSFDRLLFSRLLDPMGMKNTFRTPPKNFRGGIARSTASQSSSLWSNAQDLASFAQMLLNRGAYRHSRFFKTDTVAKFAGNQSPWSKPSHDAWTGGMFSSSAFGHNAAGGSFLWIDPDKNLFVVFLTNAGKESDDVRQLQKKIGESLESVFHDLQSTTDR